MICYGGFLKQILSRQRLQKQHKLSGLSCLNMAYFFFSILIWDFNQDHIICKKERFGMF